ncbi:MAG TPA: bifunctional 4-hydroxy-2-oxoglutarate aldolase/2-dehydro-3-deoxy-phosphogluconate aldolase [Terriglobales bacterium]|nr:bifunctional 4-hydroxy-2-oxoglutarate aldolase/2-dehydro-3-deoxy-phosphogluconate aldolase [Terriglobales bacterium]
MTPAQTLQQITQLGVIAVVRAASADQALARAEAVARGGITAIEITLTVPGAVDVIRHLRAADILVGAGTVLTAASAHACLDAGARFIVSPGFDPATAAAARSAGVLGIPGALTPTEIMAAHAAGAGAVKIFPCAQVGGPGYIRALRGPFPHIPFIPTGGVSAANLAAYLEAGAAAVGAGGELVAGSDYVVIAQRTRAFLAAVRQARGQ